MKKTFATFLLLFPILIEAGCDHATPLAADNSGNYTEKNIDSMSERIKL